MASKNAISSINDLFLGSLCFSTAPVTARRGLGMITKFVKNIAFVYVFEIISFKKISYKNMLLNLFSWLV
jgi:hypothetical protein